MTLDDKKVADIVSRVVARLQSRSPMTNPQSIRRADPPIKSKWSSSLRPEIQNPKSEIQNSSPIPAVLTAVDAQAAFSRLGFNTRFCLIEALRKAALENVERWSHEAAAETGMGRADDKVKKNRLVALKTPGPEILQKPDAWSGSHGLTTVRLDPFGVIASIIPCTNATETIINNAISMLSAGNAVVFNPHPIAKTVSADCVKTLNQALVAAGAPDQLLGCIAEPTLETAHALMQHPLVNLLLVTGGGAVVDAAMKSGKRAICAGPGNPPAVVDETADLEHAAKSLVAGASLDNNVVCTDEKAVLAVSSIADELKSLMLKENCIELKGEDIARLTDLVLLSESPKPQTPNPKPQSTSPCPHYAPNRKFVGKNASHILKELGIAAPGSTRLILVEVDKDHPLIHTEQLMPVLPLCRLKDAEEAIAHAAIVEAGRRHTASIHTQRTDRITQFVNTMNCSICVVNAPNFAGLGLGGEGYTSFSIATPTGEGLTTAKNFCRERRLILGGGTLSRM